MQGKARPPPPPPSNVGAGKTQPRNPLCSDAVSQKLKVEAGCAGGSPHVHAGPHDLPPSQARPPGAPPLLHASFNLIWSSCGHLVNLSTARQLPSTRFLCARTRARTHNCMHTQLQARAQHGRGTAEGRVHNSHGCGKLRKGAGVPGHVLLPTTRLVARQDPVTGDLVERVHHPSVRASEGHLRGGKAWGPGGTLRDPGGPGGAMPPVGHAQQQHALGKAPRVPSGELPAASHNPAPLLTENLERLAALVSLAVCFFLPSQCTSLLTSAMLPLRQALPSRRYAAHYVTGRYRLLCR